MIQMEHLHSYNNGSKLYRTTIRRILDIPIWNGNRAIDRDHCEKIRKQMESEDKPVELLDNGFHIVRITEPDASGKPCTQHYVVDGQHRLEVIRSMIPICHDYPATCVVKDVTSELEIIEYFNSINNAKPIQMATDPAMIENAYIIPLCKAFPGKNLIRSKKTHRPYLNIDDLRTEFRNHIHKLKPAKAEKFVKSILEENQKMLRDIELEFATQTRIRDKGIKESAITHKFALAVTPGLPWIRKLLNDA